MLRVASSSSSAVMKRAVVASRILSGSPIPNRHLVERTSIPNLIICNNFSTAFSSDDRKKVDRKLRKGLKSEIKSFDSCTTQITAPAGFPFSIDDEEKGELLLTRELNGEEILISIAMPDTIEEDLGVDPDHGVCLPGMLNLEVEVRKIEDGKSVMFDVHLCPHQLLVENICIMEPTEQTRDLELKGKMQSGVQEYLKTRGIKTCYAEFLYKYMVWKCKRTDLNYFKQLHQFLKR